MAATHTHAGHHDDDVLLHHQFEDIEQQNDTYYVGMWTFLVTEVMFFGALFLVYTLYRWTYPMDFYLAHKGLSVPMGAFNTVVLLISSFTMACAVHFAQVRKRMLVLGSLGVTMGLAAVFLVVKYFEYTSKFEHHLMPGPTFGSHKEYLFGANPNHSQLFYGLYFGMTGLHAVHIIIGILVIGILAGFWARKNPLVTKDYLPTEMVGLYWHFVDLVWIFLFPLMYLIPQPH
jgi:cytochrome c oxidase subunit 3